MKFRYTGRARTEIELAFSWYERQRPGLGLEFLGCVEVSIANILDFLKSYQIVYANFRRCVIRRFPFSIIFSIETGEIVVYAVFDNRQDPKNLP